MRFYLDEDVDVACCEVIRNAGHDAWSAAQAGRANDSISDGEQMIYADDHGAVWVTQDREATRRHQERSFGQHVWLHCAAPAAAEVLERHLDVIVDHLENLDPVTLDVRPDNVIVIPPRWE